MHLAIVGLLVMQYGAPPAQNPSAQNSPAEKLFEEHTYTYTGGEYENEPFEYRLLKPARLEEGKRYPVVLFLHGAGERGDDNRAQLKYLPEWMAEKEYRAKYPAIVIAPQCRKERRWVDVDWGDDKSVGMPAEPSHQMKVAMGILDHVLENYPVDKRRIYLTGLSMGGYGSWDLAMRRPKMFAAVAPVCGGGDESKAKLLVDVPIYAYHGDQDQAVPVERTRKMIAAINQAGGTPKYKELPGVGHNSWTAAYRDPDGVVPWMFEQAREK